MPGSFRNRHLLLLDSVILLCCPLVAYTLRFEGLDWIASEARVAALYTLISVPLKLALFVDFGLYSRMWRQASASDAAQIATVATLSALLCGGLGLVLLPYSGAVTHRVPISVVVLDACFTFGTLVVPRLLLKVSAARRRTVPRGAARRTLIAGAGAAGEMIVKELQCNPQLGLVPVAFVDDDRQKHGQRLCNVPVLGELSAIPNVVSRQHIDEIVIAMPTAPGSVVRRVLHMATDAGVHTRTVPGLFEILSERVGVSHLRKVEIQDLLRRAPVRTDLSAVQTVVGGRTVLVTGAGGSIGSEICRQVARLDPARLVLLGHGENSIFEILNELRRSHPTLELCPVIADIRDPVRLRSVFRRHAPHAVLHAAAHKHVPLMEGNVAEAIINNVFGTWNVVRAALEGGVEQLVSVSTDKAVRPVSVMGATKRAAELLVQQAALTHGRNFVSVRFGNVLASRGSVVPIFLSQIEAGGPVTVTDPEMRRYFMTIPEAVQLVLQASALGRGGEVFILDMGEPVRVVDLAVDLIRLSGLEVGRDIEVRFTGMRPGERLFEEIFFSSETALPTAHPKILCARDGCLDGGLEQRVKVMIAAAQTGRPEEELRSLLGTLVPDFVHSASGPQIAVTEHERSRDETVERRETAGTTGRRTALSRP